MQLTNLFASEDDRAVSPVIGVILMVAITVILAAVIGAFVLGIGGDQEETPQANLNLQCGDTGLHEGELTHRSGDPLNFDDPITAGQGNSIENSPGTLSVGETWSIGDDNSGEDLEVSDNADELVLVHGPSDSIIFDRSC